MTIFKNFKQNRFLNLFKNNNIILIIIVLIIIVLIGAYSPSISQNLIVQNLSNKTTLSKPSKIHEQNSLENYNDNFKNYNQKIQIINTQNNILAQFMVATADTPEKQRYGLMNLKKLPQNLGMLFLQDSPRQISMWMKNTFISLDMIFFDENFKINYIEKNTQPFSTKLIISPPNSYGVLEVNAGIANDFNLQIGDRLSILK